MDLASITRGPVDRPYSVVLYGPEGVGKSTWAAGAPSPVFLGTEDGTNQLDVARFPSPKDWGELLGAIRTLTAGGHEFKTLVIDSLDWVEPLLFSYVCKTNGNKKSIEEFGFGKGYVMAQAEWREFLAMLSALRETGLNIILLAHSQIKAFNDPAQVESYDRYQLKINAKSEGLIKEWPDCVLFSDFLVHLDTGEGRKAKAEGNGSRVLHTQRKPSWDAKNRHGLPPTLPLNWAAFHQAAERMKPQNIRADIDRLGKTAKKEASGKLPGALGQAGQNVMKLNRIRTWLQGEQEESKK